MGKEERDGGEEGETNGGCICELFRLECEIEGDIDCKDETPDIETDTGE